MAINLKKTVVFLMGPTASGKTDIGIQLAQQFKTRLISVDSALIYKGMNIGTAKPDTETLQKYPHYLIDICTPCQSYSVHNFIIDAKAEIQQAFANNQVPVLVGGTAFYFRALEYGLSDLPESTKQSKAKFNQLLSEKGAAKLHQKLQTLDLNAAQKIHPNDSQRIMRALSVFELSGKTLSQLHGNKQAKIDYPIKKIILMPNRAELHARIRHRFLLMLENGLIDEVKQLRKNPNLDENLPAMRCVGYRQIWQYLDAKIDKETMIEQAIIATRQLCKRQTTWLRKEQNGLVLEQPDIETILNYLNE